LCDVNNYIFYLKLNYFNSYLISLLMELELFNTRVKYENGMLWRMLKRGRWKAVKITPNKVGYSLIGLDGRMYGYHRVVFKVCNPKWDITDNSRENEVDHICAIKPLDNRIENLRILNHQQNMRNNLHFVKGYSYNKKHNKYTAQIRVNGKHIHLGHYDTAEEARAAYLKAKPIYHPI